MRGKMKDILKLSGGEWLISFVTGENPQKLEGLTDINVEVKKFSPKRSLDANALCWSTCKDIGDAMKPPLPKEEVYRKAIREVGEYEPLPIKNEAVETFLGRWSEKGVGWFAEVVDDSKIKGYKLVFAYYGSSTYNTKSMSRLIDYLVDEAEQIGITIPLGKKKEELLNAWALR